MDMSKKIQMTVQNFGTNRTSLCIGAILQIEPRANLLGVCAPFPVLSTRSLDALVHTSELHGEARA
jgi:hypothetical protein